MLRSRVVLKLTKKANRHFNRAHTSLYAKTLRRLEYGKKHFSRDSRNCLNCLSVYIYIFLVSELRARITHWLVLSATAGCYFISIVCLVTSRVFTKCNLAHKNGKNQRVFGVIYNLINSCLVHHLLWRPQGVPCALRISVTKRKNWFKLLSSSWIVHFLHVWF